MLTVNVSWANSKWSMCDNGNVSTVNPNKRPDSDKYFLIYYNLLGCSRVVAFVFL